MKILRDECWFLPIVNVPPYFGGDGFRGMVRFSEKGALPFFIYRSPIACAKNNQPFFWWLSQDMGKAPFLFY